MYSVFRIDLCGLSRECENIWGISNRIVHFAPKRTIVFGFSNRFGDVTARYAQCIRNFE